jgi:pteridine reductase
VDLSGKVALVTGAGRRLGRAIAAGLARKGAHVAVHYHRTADGAAEAVEEFRRWGLRSRAFAADLRDPGQVDRLFEEVEAEFGGLDVLVNNAGVLRRRPVLEITPDEWDDVFAVNLRAPFLCAQRAARLMRKRGGGKIVNLADLAAFQAWPSYAHHCASKAGLLALTRVLARALAPAIQVNAVAPGTVLPPEDWSEAERAELARRTALKRLGTPEDAVRAVLFLVESDYVTGATIVVDGGRLLTG